MNHLKTDFVRFLASSPDRLHFAAHSHHPWPDVSYEAHRQAWVDAADLMDDKWEYIFGNVVPETRQQIAAVLGLTRPETITFAPNTHEFAARLFSCFEPPVRILSTDAEFHTFSRQSRRWEEEGLAIVDRVAAEPFDSFAERFTAEARSGSHDMIFFSQVFFDSGFLVPGIDDIVAAITEQRPFVVIDGYHSFMALPVDLSAIEDRAFFIAGGYKYAMSGEGVCFMHCPPGFGDRPVNTGWYAAFEHLEVGDQDKVSYAKDGSRFAGATFDPSGIYRLNAVLDWLSYQGVTPQLIHDHAVKLQDRFLDSVSRTPGRLIPPRSTARGNFLAFQSDQASEHYRALHSRNVITDYRGDRLRIGFGVYHNEHDVDRLIDLVDEMDIS